ncbi:tetratricopeptide repeat protein [Flagellimonas marinaquae]
MKKLFPVYIMFMTLTSVFGQPNCNYYKYTGQLERYEACLAAEKIAGHYQFSKEFQSILDSAITLDPTWDYPYREKSTAYLKSGDFVTWKKLIDKAVKYDTLNNLYYRGRCRLNFFRDYKGAMEDFKLLELFIHSNNKNEQLLVHDGTHVDIYVALCLRHLGQLDAAINLIRGQIDKNNINPGLADHLYLGAMYLENGEYAKAIEEFKKQEQIDDLAENRFYTAKAYKALKAHNEYLSYLKTSKNYLEQGRRIHDYYVEDFYKIYAADILEEEQQAELIKKGL